MNQIPKATLSNQFQDCMHGRKLVCGLFTTYHFQPAFFEQEILPVLLDLPLSHAPAIRLVQLEDELKRLAASIAVYYDNTVLSGEAAKLDVRRIAICPSTGVFHAKTALLLLENPNDEEKGGKQALLVATMSANLTRAGWWENVESCHIEEIEAGDHSRMRDDLLTFLDRLERFSRGKAADDHASLKRIRSFLRSTVQRNQRSQDGTLHPHFYNGSSSFPDFLREAAGRALQGLNLEIISPYLEQDGEMSTLQEILDLVKPKECRLYLPRNTSGEATCTKESFQKVTDLEVIWGKMPSALLKRGRSENARFRFVHAKVYRFFQLQPKREILFIGSVNLTRSAHQRGGNFENGILVEINPVRKPDWWLEPEPTKPRLLAPEPEEGEEKSNDGTPLSIRFWWDKKKLEAFWDGPKASPKLKLLHHGVTLFELGSIEPRTWRDLPTEYWPLLHRVMVSTSFLQVETENGQEGLLLVQEEGMFCRPSLLQELSAAEILRYWSLLTVEQRMAFIETHIQEWNALVGASHLIPKPPKSVDANSIFQTFAGIFHGFSSLEKSVQRSLNPDYSRS